MPGYRRSRALWDEAGRPEAPKMALLRAILYELQPIRFSSMDWSRVRANWHASVKSVQKFGTQTVPSTLKRMIEFVRTMSLKSWMMVAGVVLYYFAVRTIHELLDAGPLIMIVTALVAIFTIGLGDNEGGDGKSAYSVFNRGFERLMGSVDVENLVNQHVGGGMAMAAMNMPQHQQQPQRRPMNNHDHDDEREDAQNDNDDGDDIPDDNNAQSRKSGKKSRRRDLQQRRELQRQRRAAMEMGLDGGADDSVAMQRLIEEQIMEERQ